MSKKHEQILHKVKYTVVQQVDKKKPNTISFQENANENLKEILLCTHHDG